MNTSLFRHTKKRPTQNQISGSSYLTLPQTTGQRGPSIDGPRCPTKSPFGATRFRLGNSLII